MILTLGWVGLALYSLAHILLIFRESDDRRLYYFLNLIAAAAFVVSAVGLESWQSMAVNLFWGATSILGLFSLGGHIKHLTGPLTKLSVFAIALFIGLPLFSLFSFADGLGWGGAILYGLAYFLLVEERVNRRRYLLINTVAALVLIPAYHVQENWPALWMSFVWTGLSGGGYLRLAWRKGAAI